jgi:heat shock protein HtpX
MSDFMFGVQNPSTEPRQIDKDNYQPPPKIRQPMLFQDQIAGNIAGTWVLMIIFIIFFTAVIWGAAQVYAPEEAVTLGVIAFVITFITSFASYYNSDKLVLSMAHARPATKEEFPALINTMEGLTIAAGLRTVPPLYIIDDEAPNAFATGRDLEHSAVAVTTGLLDKLDRYQVEGVLAHELSHVVNRDILIATLTAILVGTIVLLSDWLIRINFYGGGRRRSNDSGGGNGILAIIGLVIIILAPIVATLMQLAVSRKREYLADAHAVKLTRYPEGLAGALEAISQDTNPLEVANKATAHLYIANPLKDHGGCLNSMFSTHPPIDERIARLRSM